MPRIRVLVVDDAVVMRKMISEALGSDALLEIVGTAANGKIALEKIPQVNPDILYIAPGGRHMEVRRDEAVVRLHLHDGPPDNSCRPAVEVLVRSVSNVYGGATLALIMSGMGQDGLHGCTVLRERDATILDQDEATRVVWGMPGYVAEAGLAHQILPLQEIAGALLRLLPASRP